MNGSSEPEPSGQEFAELQRMLVGEERFRLDQVERRFDDRERRTRDVGEVLADAIQIRAARDAKLRRALEPIFEQSFRTSVRKNPEVLAETLYPVIGAAIRKAVNAALAGMVETLNQTLEKSFSLRSVQWRIEGMRTGKTFGEIMLLHSVRYAVEQVFLIHRRTGLLLAHVAKDTAVTKDADLISGMLTAVQDFVSDSFGGKDALDQIQVGEVRVWVQQGPLAILAGVIHGVPPAELRGVFQGALESIHHDLSPKLQAFQGDTSSFAAAEPALRSCLLGRSAASSKPKRHWLLALAITAICIALTVWAFFTLRDLHRSNEYLDLLAKEPGIAVTKADWRSGRFTVYGLRDPLSRDPLALVRHAGLPPGQISLHFEPYQSLNPLFTARRTLQSEQEIVERMLLRFDVGSAALSEPLLDRLEELVSHLKTLFASASALGISAKVEVVGHTDSTGTDDTNAALAVSRAAAVVEEMKAFGIGDSQFRPRGVGDKQPLRTGSREKDQAFNRSVSFRVMTGER